MLLQTQKMGECCFGLETEKAEETREATHRDWGDRTEPWAVAPQLYKEQQ